MLEFQKLLGVEIKHKLWGSGTIVDINDSTITVYFQNTNEGKRNVNFSFPSIFEKGFLYFEDVSLQNEIEQLIKKSKCYFCERTDVPTKIVSSIRICSNCESKYMQMCYICGHKYEKNTMTIAVQGYNYLYKSFLICPDCLQSYTFVCEKCEKHFIKTKDMPFLLNNKTYCEDCFFSSADFCFFCKQAFENYSLECVSTFDKNFVPICSACVENHTFICSKCGNFRLQQDKEKSPDILPELNVCKFCVTNCSVCSVRIDKQHVFSHKDKEYCASCWDKAKSTCSLCGKEYIDDDNMGLCYDCIEAKNYEARLKNLNFLSAPYKRFNYFALEHINICNLFTDLYAYSTQIGGYPFDEKNHFSLRYLIFDLFDKKLIITYLHKETIGEVKHLLNITMTNFRKKQYRLEVYNVIDNWKETSTSIMNTSAGEMKILNYPILLRVQTGFDKNYGKRWYGPDDYIEIGNYGDTTDFYIIGFIE